MSYETSVAITTRIRTHEILEALNTWAENHHRAAGFDQITSGSYASGAWVIVGHVNHLDQDSLLNSIRGAAGTPEWIGSVFDTVGVMFCTEDGVILTRQLGEDGVWR